MKLELLAASVEKKLSILANADAAAIKKAEEAFAKENRDLKAEIEILKKNLDELDLLHGCKLVFRIFILL